MEVQAIAYTVNEAAQAASVHPNTIRRALDRGDLDKHYLGTKILILADDVREWIRAMPREKPAVKP